MYPFDGRADTEHAGQDLTVHMLYITQTLRRTQLIERFPGSSAGSSPAMQEGLVQFLGREDSPGEGIGYPLQYSWASRVAQLVKHPPAIRETWVPSLGWEDPLEKEKATHSSILA